MRSLKGVVRASLIAPLVLAIPAAVLATATMILARYFFVSDQDWAGDVGAVAIFVVSLYLALVLLGFSMSLALRHLGIPSKRLATGIAVVAAVATVLPMSCDWSSSCDVHELAVNVPLFTAVLLAALAAFVSTWWRLVRRGQ